MERNDVVCDCFAVTMGEIEEAIRTKNLKTVEQVGEITNAGTGCGGCTEKIQAILDRING